MDGLCHSLLFFLGIFPPPLCLFFLSPFFRCLHPFRVDFPHIVRVVCLHLLFLLRSLHRVVESCLCNVFAFCSYCISAPCFCVWCLLLVEFYRGVLSSASSPYLPFNILTSQTSGVTSFVENMNLWMDQPGYPVLSVTYQNDQRNVIQLEQSRFLLFQYTKKQEEKDKEADGEKKAESVRPRADAEPVVDPPPQWWIPVSFRAKDQNALHEGHTSFSQIRSEFIRVADGDVAWMKLNNGEHGEEGVSFFFCGSWWSGSCLSSTHESPSSHSSCQVSIE